MRAPAKNNMESVRGGLDNVNLSQDIQLDRLAIHGFLGAGKDPEIAEKEEAITDGLRRFFEQHLKSCIGTPSRRAAKFNDPDVTAATCVSAVIEQPETFAEHSKVLGMWFAHQMEVAGAPPAFLAVALLTDLDTDNRYLAMLRLDPTSAFVRHGAKFETINILPDPARPLARYAIARPHSDDSRYDLLYRNTHEAIDTQRGEEDVWLSGFLEAFEVSTPRQMTQLVVKETEKWIAANEGAIEEGTAADLRAAVRTMAQGEEMDIEQIAASAIKDEAQREEYVSRLLDRGLTEPQFQPDKEWAEKYSRSTTYLCDDNVKISGPSDAIDQVVQVLPKTPDRKTRIVIETRKFQQK